MDAPFSVSQFAFVGGVISPQLWGRVDVEKYQYGLKTAQNFLSRKYGGLYNRQGTKFVGEVKNSAKATRILGFSFNVVQSYILEFGEQSMRPIRDGGHITETPVTITSMTNANPGVFGKTTHGLSVGQELYIATLPGTTGIAGRNFLVNSVPTADTFTLKDLYGTALNTTSSGTYTGSGTYARLYAITTPPYDDSEVFDVGYAQTNDTGYFGHLGYTVRKLTRSGHANWTMAAVTWGPTLAAPANEAAAATVGSGATTYSYKITAIDDDTGQESLPSDAASCTNDLTVSGNYNTVSWDAVAGAERYAIYKDDNGIYGFIGGTTGTSFIDDNIAADLGDTPPQARDPFNSSSNYPCRLTFHENRLYLGFTTNNPNAVWASQVANYENLNVSVPAKADDAISFRLVSKGVNAVCGLSSYARGLALFTSAVEFSVDGAGVTTYQTPASIVPRRLGARGAAQRPEPLEVGDYVLYAQRQGGTIRAFGYSFEKDGATSSDLTLLAPHLFKGHTIVDWAYAQDPEGQVWCVRDDGALLCLTILEEQQVFSWTGPHYVGGTFGAGDSATGYGVVESVAVIEGDDVDEVYLVVKRTINGATKRYIERLTARWDADADDIEDAYFVDCGKSYSGSPATSFSLLHHLEGQTVVALADGNVVPDLTVSAGAVTLPAAASVVHIGLPYLCDAETLPLEKVFNGESTEGRRKVVNEVAIQLHGTRGLTIGSSAGNLLPFKERDGEAWNDPIAPYTGTRKAKITNEWGDTAKVYCRQAYPLPAEILAIHPKIMAGG